MSVFTAELKKLWILFKADPKSLVAGIIAPTILLLVFAITFGDFTSLKLAYVNEDPGPYGKALETSLFTQVSPLGDKPYFEEISAEYETAMDLYAQGKVNGVVVVGETFSADLQQGGNASIDYWFNNYNTDMAKNLRLYLQEGILDFYRTTDPQVQIQVEEVLKRSIAMDEGSSYLGEVALVPYDSPIRNTGILFYNTLFDENASCHLAFGSAYPTCVKGGEKLSEAQQKKAGLNQSANHVDFMVGTADLSIVGRTHDGAEVPVFVNGNFAF